MNVHPNDLKPIDVQCPRCFGRGYTLTYPPGKIRTLNCPRCGGCGQIRVNPWKVRRRVGEGYFIVQAGNRREKFIGNSDGAGIKGVTLATERNKKLGFPP